MGHYCRKKQKQKRIHHIVDACGSKELSKVPFFFSFLKQTKGQAKREREPLAVCASWRDGGGTEVLAAAGDRRGAWQTQAARLGDSPLGERRDRRVTRKWRSARRSVLALYDAHVTPRGPLIYRGTSCVHLN